MKGLEPPRLAAPDPKSSASTNFATSANAGAKVIFLGTTANFVEDITEKHT